MCWHRDNQIDQFNRIGTQINPHIHGNLTEFAINDHCDTGGLTAHRRNVDHTVDGTETTGYLYLRLFTATNSRWIKTELVKAKR